VIVFDDTGQLLPDGRAIPPHRPVAPGRRYRRDQTVAGLMQRAREGEVGCCSRFGVDGGRRDGAAAQQATTLAVVDYLRSVPTPVSQL
jgi:hypothetical protein